MKKRTGKKLAKGESSKCNTTKNVDKKNKKRKRENVEKGESSKRRKKTKRSSSDEKLGERRRKRSKKNEWFGIRTRSSPLQLFKCISILKQNQREAVSKMGFGKLLSFGVDGIPAKLGHYVVDRFNTKKMEIQMPCGKIKVDKEAIHQLLGLPCRGIQLDKIIESNSLDDSVGKWKDRYPGHLVAPTQIVKRIENSDDEDNFNFRLDFLMLFLAIMVECHKQGSCKSKILKLIKGDTEFNEIDWCSYIVESMKTCKEGWRRCDLNSPFAGPITILTLLYVKSVDCKGMSVDETIDAITFWNMDRLKFREKLEIKGGGFGKGKFKGSSLATNNPSHGDVQRICEKDFLDEMSKVEKRFDIMVKNKKKVEETLSQLYQKYPDKKEVLTLMARYDSLLEDKPKWPPKPTEENMENDAKINYLLAAIGEHVNTDKKRSDDKQTNEGYDTGERKTDEDPIVFANFITSFVQLEKSSAGGNEAGAKGAEKLVEAGTEIVVDQDKQAESTKGNGSVDDSMDQEMIEVKDESDASEGIIIIDDDE